MKESYVKGLANHDGPESCVAWSDSRGEALTGDCVGWVLSHEKKIWDAHPVEKRGRPQSRFRFGKEHWYLARSETPGMHRSNLRENREVLRSPMRAHMGRIVKSKDVRR